MSDLGRFTPALVLAVAFGFALGIPWARRARVAWPLAIATWLSVGVILAITLSPTGPQTVDFVPGTCELQGFWPGGLDQVFSFGETSLNVALFLPLGLCVGLHRPSRSSAILLVGAVLLPVGIELVQLQLPALGRYCDSRDVADNLLGLAVGLAVGAVIGGVARLVAGSVPRRGSPGEP